MVLINFWRILGWTRFMIRIFDTFSFHFNNRWKMWARVLFIINIPRIFPAYIEKIYCEYQAKKKLYWKPKVQINYLFSEWIFTVCQYNYTDEMESIIKNPSTLCYIFDLLRYIHNYFIIFNEIRIWFSFKVSPFNKIASGFYQTIKKKKLESLVFIIQ